MNAKIPVFPFCIKAIINLSLYNLHDCVNKFTTDAIFEQVIFSRLRASSYNFENNEKYNMNLRFIEV